MHIYEIAAFFCNVSSRCASRGIWGKELSIDATKVDANASVDSLTTRFAYEARQALQNHLQQLFQEEDDHHPPEPDPLSLEADQEPTPLPVVLPQEGREELDAELNARHDGFAKGGEHQREVRGLYR